jgi:signal transduction histidine kinase/AmiR/NasT family two-component response regulator
MSNNAAPGAIEGIRHGSESAQALISTILHTAAARYLFVSIWGVALVPMVGLPTAAFWWLGTTALSLLRTGFEIWLGRRPSRPLWSLPVVGMFTGVGWATAPWLAWTSGHAFGRPVAIMLLASGYQIAFTQLSSRPKMAAIITTPYAVTAIGIGATLWGTAEFPGFLTGLTLLAAQLTFTVAFGGQAQRSLDKSLRRQTRLIDDLELARDRADAADRAKSAFLGSISHELRTPMNGVLGAAQLLAGTALDPPQREYVGIIQDSGAVLSGLLNDILEMTRVLAEGVQIEASEVDVAALIPRIVEPWSARAAAKGLDFDVEIDPAIPALVLADPGRLTQILNSLLSNAVKFTTAGEIRLCVDAERQDDDTARLRIAVHDTGVGIVLADLPRVFESFGRLDASATDSPGGAGLGLSFSRKLAQAMGGELTVESEPGVGSIFTVAASVRVVFWTRLGAPMIANDAPRRLKILVVEDHVVNRKILETALTTFGHDVVTAGDGAEAVALCGLQAFDVILTDINMPNMDGLTATREIRGRPGPNQEAPVIILSASAQPKDHLAGYEAGADAYFNKPIDLSELAVMVERAGSGRHTLRATQAGLGGLRLVS